MPDAVMVQLNEGERARLSTDLSSAPAPESKGPDEIKEGFCERPLTTIPYVTLIAGAFFVLIFGLASLGLNSLIWAAGVVALVGSTGVAGYLCWTGGLRHQLKRFKQENARLKNTSMKLEGDVNKLEVTNQKITVQVEKLNATVDDLQGVSNSLQKDLAGFSDLRQSVNEFANQTGEDMAKALGNVNAVYDRMYDLTLENERALLKRVAQDLEFMDRDEEMSKMEFHRFLHRVPTQFKDRFESMGLTFEAVAGEDQEIDFKEMGALIEKLLAENDEKKHVSAQKVVATTGQPS